MKGRRLLPAVGPILLLLARPASSQPIARHPENPHVFLWKGKAKVFVASGEHYGALVNREFDYRLYFRTLQKVGLQHTRLFLGDTLDAPDTFGGILAGIDTLEPAPGQFICPWARSDTPGFARGGNKFDLDRWDPQYFRRLHDLFGEAARRDVTIEAVLFFVGPSWTIMPLHPANNVNGTEAVEDTGYLVPRPGSRLQAYQEAYVRKLVGELNRYNHFLWNVANEPWLNNAEGPERKAGLKGDRTQWSGIRAEEATKTWIRMVAGWIRDEESKRPKKHLVGVDITNEGHLVRESDLSDYYRDLDVLNVHYDSPALSLDLNYHRIDRILTYNETGLTETKLAPSYRTDGWYYLMSGGGLYGNLDWTFYQGGHEDGSFDPEFPGWYKGSGDRQVKHQLAVLQAFMDGLPLGKMFRDESSCAGGGALRILTEDLGASRRSGGRPGPGEATLPVAPPSS